MKKLSLIILLVGIVFSSCDQKKEKYDPYKTGAPTENVKTSNSTSFEVDFKNTDSNTKNIHIKLNDANGYDALFDTGCSGMMISSLELIDLIKSGTLTENDYVGQSTVTLADGSQVKHPIYNIRSISLTDKTGVTHTLNDILATVEKNPEANMIIGNSVIDNFAKNHYTVDLKNNVIIFD